MIAMDWPAEARALAISLLVSRPSLPAQGRLDIVPAVAGSVLALSLPLMRCRNPDIRQASEVLAAFFVQAADDEWMGEALVGFERRTRIAGPGAGLSGFSLTTRCAISPGRA